MRSGRILKKFNFDTKCIYSGRETQNPFEGFFAHHNFCLKNIEFTRILKSINDSHYTKLII